MIDDYKCEKRSINADQNEFTKKSKNNPEFKGTKSADAHAH